MCVLYISNLAVGITNRNTTQAIAFSHQYGDSSLSILPNLDKSVYRLNPLDRRVLAISEHNKIRCFETTLAICSACNLTPDQAVEEFKEACGKNSPSIYFEWWRSCWEEFEITPEMVTAWLTRVNRKGWIKRLGGAE